MLAEVEQTIDLRNLDKSGWESYRFDEIAHNISERIDPNNTDLEVYIGLEHIDSESIHIKRFGTRDDVNGQKLRFYPGDIIFGRRRAYQRKAGIAEKDGFCSAHALVLRANPNIIEPSLFPFFLHSDAFMHRAVDISVGSLSPTINWGTLKKQEFLIPPKEQQFKLAELLWTMDDILEKEEKIFVKNEELFLSLSKEIFTNEQGVTKKLIDIADLIMGQSPPGDSYNTHGDGMPFLQGNAEFGEKTPLHAKYTNKPNKIAPEKSILFSVRAPVGDLNVAEQEYCIGRGLAAIVIEDELMRNYVFNFLKFFRVQLEKHSTGSTFKSVNKDTLSSVTLVVPSYEAIDYSVKKLLSTEVVKERLLLKLKSSKSLQKSLINQIF